MVSLGKPLREGKAAQAYPARGAFARMAPAGTGRIQRAGMFLRGFPRYGDGRRSILRAGALLKTSDDVWRTRGRCRLTRKRLNVGKGASCTEEYCAPVSRKAAPGYPARGSLPRQERPCCSWSASCAGEGCWSILKFPWASSVRGRLHSACAAGPAKMPAAEGQRRGRRVPARSARKSSA